MVTLANEDCSLLLEAAVEGVWFGLAEASEAIWLLDCTVMPITETSSLPSFQLTLINSSNNLTSLQNILIKHKYLNQL